MRLVAAASWWATAGRRRQQGRLSRLRAWARGGRTGREVGNEGAAQSQIKDGVEQDQARAADA